MKTGIVLPKREKIVYNSALCDGILLLV